jgi:hypothetical protein
MTDEATSESQKIIIHRAGFIGAILLTWRELVRNFLVTAAGSDGRCNTIQRFDSRMLLRQNPSVRPCSIKT